MSEQANSGGMIPWRKNRGPKPKFTEEQVETAIYEERGNITATAKRLGCTPQTVYSYVEESQELQYAVMYAREIRKDEYEAALDKRREAGSDAAIIFFLKTQAKDRGYIERHEIDTNINIVVDVDDDFNPPTSVDAEFDVDENDDEEKPNDES
jgi:hypothetical protein